MRRNRRSNALKVMLAYLKITAPFDGIVTDRLVHPGALGGTAFGSRSSGDPAGVASCAWWCRFQRRTSAASCAERALSSSVPAYPHRAYSGKIARISRSAGPKDPHHGGGAGRLESRRNARSGHVSQREMAGPRAGPALWVPKTSVVTTTERTFVVRDHDGHAEWVDVKKGVTEGDLVEVLGNLKAGDMVVRRANDELREGDGTAGARQVSLRSESRLAGRSILRRQPWRARRSFAISSALVRADSACSDSAARWPFARYASICGLFAR